MKNMTSEPLQDEVIGFDERKLYDDGAEEILDYEFQMK